MLTLYGIPNCDTIRKARRWLEQHQLDYEFHDYKKQGIDSQTLKTWCGVFGYENLLNRRGTTWRKLPDSDKAALTRDKAITLMITNPSIIKRPVLETGTDYLLGFDQSRYEMLL